MVKCLKLFVGLSFEEKWCSFNFLNFLLLSEYNLNDNSSSRAKSKLILSK